MDIRDRLLDLARAQPFHPFLISMSNGRDLLVPGPEWLIVGKRWSTLGYIDENGYDRIVTIHHQNVNTIEHYDPAQSPNGPTPSPNPAAG